MTAYCVKCKDNRAIEQAKVVLMKNNRPRITGICLECGGKVSKLTTLEDKTQA